MRLAIQSKFIPLENVVYFITLPFLVRKIFTFYINDVLLFKCPLPGPKGHGGVSENMPDSVAQSGCAKNSATRIVSYPRRVFDT